MGGVEGPRLLSCTVSSRSPARRRSMGSDQGRPVLALGELCDVRCHALGGGLAGGQDGGGRLPPRQEPVDVGAPLGELGGERENLGQGLVAVRRAGAAAGRARKGGRRRPAPRSRRTHRKMRAARPDRPHKLDLIQRYFGDYVAIIARSGPEIQVVSTWTFTELTSRALAGLARQGTPEPGRGRRGACRSRDRRWPGEPARAGSGLGEVAASAISIESDSTDTFRASGPPSDNRGNGCP